ncbi:MAG TPA: hypothetical protein VND21_08785 [Planctomycetota bacterium]|nr:hypothetical protein [Planctomycetota bacterium]
MPIHPVALGLIVALGITIGVGARHWLGRVRGWPAFFGLLCIVAGSVGVVLGSHPPQEFEIALLVMGVALLGVALVRGAGLRAAESVKKRGKPLTSSRFDQILLVTVLVGLGLTIFLALRGPPRRYPAVTDEEWAAAPTAIWAEVVAELRSSRPLRMGPARSAEEPPWPEVFEESDDPRFVGLLAKYPYSPAGVVGYAATENVVRGEEGSWREFRRVDRQETLRRVPPNLRIAPEPAK